jgi:hypothetical protein
MLDRLNGDWLETNGLGGVGLSTLAHMSAFEPPLDLPGARWDQRKEVVFSFHKGNLYAFGPEGVCILSTAGKHLGSGIPLKHRHNFARSDDVRALYLADRVAVYKLRLNIAGVRQ